MSDVTRYTVTNATGWMQPWPTSLPATMVRASDYDALAKRLKEAERCIKAANDALHGYGVEDQGQAWDKACRLLDEYQRATDSADECLGCSSPTSCAKNGCAIKRQRATDSASVVQYKPCEICTTQSWCETHGCQCYPVSAVQPERCCLDYPRCDCNSPPEPDDDWLCFQRPAQPKVTP